MAGITRIIGVGNPLMGDDGIGIVAAERLAQEPLYPGVEVLDGGTGGLTLLGLMEGCDRVILLDAVEMGSPPGSVRRFTLEEVLPAKAQGTLSLHQAGLAEVLALGREMGQLPPELILLGVQPLRVERRLGLSHPLESALKVLLERTRTEIGIARMTSLDGRQFP